MQTLSKEQPITGVFINSETRREHQRTNRLSTNTVEALDPYPLDASAATAFSYARSHANLGQRLPEWARGTGFVGGTRTMTFLISETGLQQRVVALEAAFTTRLAAITSAPPSAWLWVVTTIINW